MLRAPFDPFYNPWMDYDPFSSFTSPLDDFFFAPDRLFQQPRRLEGGMDWEKREGQGEGLQPASKETQLQAPSRASDVAPWLSTQREVIPRVSLDLVSEPDHYYVKAEIPGMSKRDVNVAFHNGLLTIDGKKSDEHRTQEQKEGWNIIRRERAMGSFSRTLRLPRDALEENVKASMVNGLLTVCIPRNQQMKKELKGRIEIEETESRPQIGGAQESAPQQSVRSAEHQRP